MSRTLILACSETKREERKPLPALHRYDGPAWRTLRANVSPYALLHELAELEAYALSAEHGLIRASEPIAHYDRRMTPARAAELLEATRERLEDLETCGELGGEILFVGGATYRGLLMQATAAAVGNRITYTRGGIGEQLGQLKAWLRRTA